MSVLAVLTTAALAAATSPADTSSAPAMPPTTSAIAVDPRLAPRAAADTTRPRRRAVELSDWYYRRLTVHRIGSYAMLPLFGAEYLLGNKLLNQREDALRGVGGGVSDDVRTWHQVTAGGIAVLFGVNTVTGLWNLYDTRAQPEGRKLRTIHTVLMLASDAGFAATGLIAGRASDGSVDDARTHRNVALISMAPATVGTVMMWVDHLRK